MVNEYLEKHAIRDALVSQKPNGDLGISIVMPVFNEKSVIPSLISLNKCLKPKQGVEVILVFNASEKADETIITTNERAKQEAVAWYSKLNQSNFDLHCITEHKLPYKHAGVGLARKLGMDEAVRRFQSVQRQDGIIACFDADSQCDENYLIELEKHFDRYPLISACSIYFEHPTSGKEFSKEVYDYITWYEMHLRYYKLALSYAKMPFAYHSIGSSMAVRMKAYCKEGGMNKRKAGEDFYFLQKFIDKQSINELNNTRVFPSPRPSDRVPFGTGRSILDAMNSNRTIEHTYSFDTFQTIKEIFADVEQWFKTDPKPHSFLLDFIGREFFNKKIEELRKHSTNSERFRFRFFQWFNGFKCLKFIHFLRDHHFPMTSLRGEVPRLLIALNQKADTSDERNLLIRLREVEKNSNESR